MANIQVKIETEKFIAELEKLSNDVKEKVKRELVWAGVETQNRARVNCPVDTGTLRNSITYEPKGDFDVVVGAYTDYASYVEYGTRKMNAQPYLIPAFEEVSKELYTRLQQILSEVK